MTFNSYVFLFVFLPIVIAGYYLLTRLLGDQRPALTWLVLASLVFYGSQGFGYLAVLAVSVIGNFLIAWLLSTRPVGSRARTTVLIGGIAANLVLLGAYKYTGFLADNINSLFGTHLNAVVQTYPVGLSFYTFIQIGFLIDTSVGQTARPAFLRYALFGTFFPYVTAGPIVRRNEVLSQLDTPVRERTGTTQVAVGATMFAMGLFKKAVLADNVAPFAGGLFGFASGHDAIGPANGWLGMAAYTLQLYFDFSGYTDMALGLGYMLGIRLPVNFNSPLRATSIVDFWRRWHMTMTRFFTDYIYTPVAAGLMRRSIQRRYPAAVRVLLVLCLPVVVTFLLVGLWHGAGWGFVIWGAFQGVAMAINLTWRELQTRLRLPRIPSPVGWTMTMITFITSLTFFRAPNIHTALVVLRAMFGLGPAGAAPGQFYGAGKVLGTVPIVPAVVWVALLTAIALFFPRNTQQILGQYEVGLPTIASPEHKSRIALVWHPTVRWALASGVLLAIALVFAGGPSPFLYYRF
jgi:D-alanyl-lipoteichoic acid acyltransferase DltB (MBOAT superfamily)